MSEALLLMLHSFMKGKTLNDSINVLAEIQISLHFFMDNFLGKESTLFRTKGIIQFIIFTPVTYFTIRGVKIMN